MILLRNTLKKYLGDRLPKVTDISDEDLVHSFPNITAKEMPEYVDIVISAMNEFMDKSRGV